MTLHMSTGPADNQICSACHRSPEECQCYTTRVNLTTTQLTLSSGTIEGRYRIIEKIGVGGMGTVYRAEHVVLQRQVALKVLRSELLSDNLAMARFEQESRACAALSHPNLVAVYDCGITATRQPYLVMEYISGRNLMEVIKADGTMSLPNFFDVFVEVASALSYAHNNGVIHRDMKPSNIVLTIDPRNKKLIPKIVDFGVAKIEDLGGELQMLTRTGEVFGSPAYMSPEQCSGDPIDQRADLYALGCVMYEALCGRQPLRGESMIATMTKQMEELPAPPSKMRDGKTVPGDLQKLILTCLKKRPSERYENMEVLKEELEKSRDKLTINRPVRVGKFELPAFTVPFIVLMAILSSLFCFPVLMPGGSLDNWIGTVKGAPVSRAMLAGYCDRVQMEDYATEKYRSIVDGPDSKDFSTTDRLSAAVVLFDRLYSSEKGCRDILSLFEKPLAPMVEQVEQSIKSGTNRSSTVGWSIPLLFYYVGGAQERFHNKIVAESRYKDGVRLADWLSSPKWVKAKLREELAELYLSEADKPLRDSIKLLQDAIVLLQDEKKSVQQGRQEAMFDMTKMLFKALQEDGQGEEAANTMKQFILHERELEKADPFRIANAMAILVSFYKHSDNQDEARRWRSELKDYQSSLRHEHSGRVPFNSFEDAPDSVLVARANLFREDEQILFNSAFLEAYYSAEKRGRPDLQKIAIAAPAFSAYEKYLLLDDAERFFRHVAPVLESVKHDSIAIAGARSGYTGQAPAIFCSLAELENRTKHFSKAEQFAKQGLPYCEGQPGPERKWWTGRLECNLAKSYIEQGIKLDKAEQLMKGAIEKMTAFGDADNYRIADGYLALGRLYKRQSKFEEARSSINKAIAIVGKNNWQRWRIEAEYKPELDDIDHHEKSRK